VLGGGSGPKTPAVRPWREIRPLLLLVLQRETVFSKQAVKEKKKNRDFRVKVSLSAESLLRKRQ